MKMFKYKLINWVKAIPIYRGRPVEKPAKIVEMTEEEAYELNRGLTMNGTGMRYVKLEEGEPDA